VGVVLGESKAVLFGEKKVVLLDKSRRASAWREKVCFLGVQSRNLCFVKVGMVLGERGGSQA
jgi:hypothetical protein